MSLAEIFSSICTNLYAVGVKFIFSHGDKYVTITCESPFISYSLSEHYNIQVLTFYSKLVTVCLDEFAEISIHAFIT